MFILPDIWIMLRNSLIIFILITPLLTYGQTDSTAIMMAEPDSLITGKTAPGLYWYDIEQRIHGPEDSLRNKVYQKPGEHGLNYIDFGDLFREEALWFNFDLNESGRPLYLAPVQMYPHQTAFRYGGVVMNDPAHGMYNGQFISPVNLKAVEADGISGAVAAMGMAGPALINATPYSTHKEDPWTRIVFKQGAFGFSMLDISFAKSFSDKFSLQLGGYNNLYDGTLLTANHKGNNLRAEMTWQYAPNLYIRGHIFLDRHRIGLAQYEILNEVALPKIHETQDNYVLDVTWQPVTGQKDRLHAIMYASSYFKELRDENYPVYYIEHENVRYGFDTNYRWHFNDLEIMAGGGAQYANVWGIPFETMYHPLNGNVYSVINIGLTNDIGLGLSGAVAMKNRFSAQWSGTADLTIQPGMNQAIKIQAGRSVRFPSTSEMFYHFDSLSGNPELQPETHNRVELMYRLGHTSGGYIGIKAGAHMVEKEVVWEGLTYFNSQTKREFAFSGIDAGFNFWKLEITGGGQYSFADLALTPKSSFWAKLHFHDVWLDGALILDLYGMFHFYDEHRDILFDPRIDRFFPGDDMTKSYSLLNWKAVAQIQQALVFFEMDNSMSSEYVVVRGYNEFYIRWRFGVDWVLWD